MSADAPATPFIHLLDERVVRVEGDDAREWINGQVTAALREPRPGSTYALVLTLQGRVQSDAWLSDEGEHLVMRLPEAAADAVLAHLDRYIIMEDVELEPDPRRVLHVAGPGAAARVKSAGLEGLATPRLDAEGVDLLLPEDGLEAARRALIEAGVDEVDEAGWERARIARGVPRWGRDFGADTLPQEAGLKHAVSFDKGCYLGQEPVVMLEHRGKPPKRLVRLELEDAVEVGAPVEAAERQVGRVTSAAGTRALALVKRKALEGEAPLEVGGRALTRWALVEGDATVARAGGEP